MGDTLKQRASMMLAAAAVALAASTAALHAQGFERATSFDPARIPGIRVSGPNYVINNPVTSDGFMRIYVLKTSYGDFTVIGDALMRTRLVELAALVELDRLTDSESFNKSLTEAGLAPIKYAGDLVTNPGQTLSNTFSGVGSLFGQVGSGLGNLGKTQDDTMQGLLGVNKKRRELAAHLGVDPYTDFPPLATKMTQLSQAAATGGLVVSAALMAIPGVGGIIVANVATTAKVTGLARDLTAAQLMDLNRRKLAEMAVNTNVAETLLTNRSFSPLDVTAIVACLESMSSAQNRGEFVARAASVHRHDAAFFMRRHAELLADYHAKTGSLTGFVTFGGYPFNTTRTGGVLGILPIDALSWTDNTARSMRDIVNQSRSAGFAGKAEMRITGQATALAKQQLQGMGWTVTDNFR
jgi:hypothetical protein